MYACVYETGSGLFDGLCKQENRLLTFRNSLLDSRIDSGRRTLVVASVWVYYRIAAMGFQECTFPPFGALASGQCAKLSRVASCSSSRPGVDM
jgi:hypothetical protein